MTTTALTLAQYEALDAPEHEMWELVDGSVAVVPFENVPNVDAASALSVVLFAHLPRAQWYIVCHAGLLLRDEPPTVRIPDLLVASAAEHPQRLFTPRRTRLVVEVLSDSTARTDLGTKRREYAAAGIPAYLVIDVRGARPTLRLFDTISGGDYADTPATQTVTLRIDDHDIPLDAADLRRWA